MGLGHRVGGAIAAVGVALAVMTACNGTSPAGPADAGAYDAATDAVGADGTTTGPACASNADCDPTTQFCQKITCGAATGVCAVRPGTRQTGYCTPSNELACGCDGMTYADACLANAEGVNVASEGACPLPEGGAACTSTAGCGAGLYCKTATCGASSGTCEPMPAFVSCDLDAGTTCVDAGGETVCTVDTPLVCGCDHETYASPCEAASYGVNLASDAACPPLPTGPCTSQADCGGASYAALVFCMPTTCGQAAGACTPIPSACPALSAPVCGCDGNRYENSCFSDQASVGVAYGGPCRSGAIVACSASAPCAAGQVCVNDPRAACDGGAGCAGVCVDWTTASCGSGGGCEDAVYQACISPQTPAGTCGAGPCGACVYTAGTGCNASSPCTSSQLCVPIAECGGGACPSVCVLP